MEHEATDGDLIERARGGDGEAFGELVRRHRSKAYDWARSVARDPFLAEDIVQEALLRAFLHLGTLADMNRFLPWLHRIVRNEALMKLRKGEFSGKERTFTALIGSATVSSEVDWADLDSILYYMCGSRERDGGRGGDPSALLAQKEFLETIRQLLRCLTGKERAVFEAYFFRQLSPSEIALLFGTSADNVYQSLSRVRSKVKIERSRERYRDYLRETLEPGLPERASVSTVLRRKSQEWKRCGTSFAGAVYALLPYTQAKPYSLTEVMGLTSQAFRLTVEAECIDVSGPSMYFWEPVFHDGLLNLGLESEHAGDGGVPPSPFMLHKGISLIRKSVVAGIPVAAWDLFSPEFGIISGYDDREQLLHAEDAKARKSIPYDQLGKGISGGLFVLAVTGSCELLPWEAVLNALRMAVRHAYGERTFVGYVCGLTAYDCWIEAFRNRTVQPLGNAYTIRVLRDARTHAAAFLEGLAGQWAKAGYDTSVSMAAEAAEKYSAVAAVLMELERLFPFPQSGAPNDPSVSQTAIRLLLQAKNEEEAGVLELKRLLRCLELIAATSEVEGTL
ncbi:RNA polymerase sigma factor [Paenibacillus ginsengarvi]|uniref:RNA polymerase sigma factor n=1 Tax=Paenibacillus ginsengarvi TaxID=400777 RepID=A0A3B0CF59_9BACL|nr:sigma-70 family RNA polymerase sigma factor [Paenibacillus ginsengarvi]RKN84273.1 sigma-70 family RNA polymerase sigma factor [Paenibacillus ginsengarvi]